jgi:hypothetical protein
MNSRIVFALAVVSAFALCFAAAVPASMAQGGGLRRRDAPVGVAATGSVEEQMKNPVVSAREKAEAERRENDQDAAKRNAEGAVSANERVAKAKAAAHEEAKAEKAAANAAEARRLAEEERSNRELKDADRKPAPVPLKKTASMESMQYSENSTKEELKAAMATQKPDSTVLKKALTAHQQRVSGRAAETREEAEQARQAAVKERTERDLSGGQEHRTWDPRTTKVDHIKANIVPEPETCGIRHCKDADHQLQLKFGREPLEHFLDRCVKHYNDWKLTVGYNLDCKDSGNPNSTEFTEPWKGFNQLKHNYEERLKAIQEHKAERMSILGRHAADDGRVHSNVTMEERKELERKEDNDSKNEAIGHTKIRRKQMTDKMKYNTEVEDRKTNKLGWVYEDGRKNNVFKRRPPTIEEAPKEGWGPGYTVSTMRL